MGRFLYDRLHSTIDHRKGRGLLRSVVIPPPSACDFSSNDYLGLANNKSFGQFLNNFLKSRSDVTSIGSTGSRLLSGHSKLFEELENHAAQFHKAESALVFNSGYDANLSLLSCIADKEDVILYDELIHASVHDGMRMSRASASLHSFSHNDVNSLRSLILKVISNCNKSIIVCIETVYSMDGDIAPLKEMLDLAETLEKETGHDIYIIADEAHAGYLYGTYGEGLTVAEDMHLHPNLLARVVTFGKAFASHGAVVLGTVVLKDYLINYARPFIYSTALPPHSVATLLGIYHFIASSESSQARTTLWSLVDHFRKLANMHLPRHALLPNSNRSPIHGILVPNNEQCMAATNYLRGRGFNVYGIRSPTVPRGTERIRVIIHAHNTEKEISLLIHTLAKWFQSVATRSRL